MKTAMGSGRNVPFDGTNGLNATKKARELNSFPEHAIFNHILPFDFNFRIKKKSLILNSIEKLYNAFK